MADQHFWDNGISERSTAVEYRLKYEDLNNNVITSGYMTLDKAAAEFEQLKSNRQTAWCDLLHRTTDESGNVVEVSQQSFEFKVLDIDGVKIII